jgi:hypothetical protein
MFCFAQSLVETILNACSVKYLLCRGGRHKLKIYSSALIVICKPKLLTGDVTCQPQ